MEPSEYPVEVASDQARGFVDNYFADIDLGHKSRTACFHKVATQISRHPGGTLPDKLGSPACYAAMDRLMNRPETTHAKILEAHRRQTLAKMAASDGVVLIVHDTTVLDYSGLKSVQLAKVGNGHGRGYLCHNSLAVEPQQRAVFGLVAQILHQRVSRGKKEPVARKRRRASRESRLWSRAVQELPAAPPGRRYIDVADRGADVFEFLYTEHHLGRDCLVRSTYNRRIRLGHDGQGQQVLLHEYLRTLPAVGAARTQTIHDPSTQQERTARLRVASAAVEILPPHVAKGEYEKKPLPAWAVRVWEETPPAGATPLEWFLLCLHPVTTAAEAWQQCDWYGCRWMVEEYHKAQKTGCQIEELQFHTEEALQPMIGLLSVVAVLLLNLREAARRPDAATRLATAVVEPIYEEVLRHWRHPKKAQAPFSVLEFYRAVARLGGHMNRKGDGFPGWLTLWRGWQKLEIMVEAVRLDRRRQRKIV
jgi:Transposase Tn5 dimerisation domain